MTAILDRSLHASAHSVAGDADLDCLVFVDAQVDNLQTLAASAVPGAELVVLQADRDGVRQITEVLAQRHNLSNLHIISDGSSGSLFLGSAWLNVANLEGYAPELHTWSTALAENASIMLHNYDVAMGEMGHWFVGRLAELTGRSVVA